MTRRTHTAPLASTQCILARPGEVDADLILPQVERQMAVARPRLLRFVRAHGIAADTADDVVQETLLEAWRHLDDLYGPDRFDAWLSAICRNVCQRYVRNAGLLARRQTSLPDPTSWDQWGEPDEGLQPEIPAPDAFDPVTDLERQDLETLLDRALSYLPEPARDAVELCYLAELPQREAALQLGLTIRALEARLHRARKQLRQVLSGALRTEAHSFGLALDDDMVAGWRETRLWCRSCGRRREGAFVVLPGGGVSLRVRCPGCRRAVDTRGLVPLAGTRSFLPAHKRLVRYLTTYLTSGLATGWQACPFCGARQPVQIVGPDTPGGGRASSGLKVLLGCTACGEHVDLPIGLLVGSCSEAQRFMAQHPRWTNEPEAFLEYEGRPAICIRLADVAGAARLTILADPQTLQVLRAFVE
jgi:RNA polymerase sigma factor (sigma-70 family)